MNKAGGFITLHRQILDWEWYKDVNTAFLFIHLLLSANFVDAMFKGKLIKRGQLVTSLSHLSTETGLSVQQTRTALSHLVSTGEITDESTPNYRIITVVKYDDYQKSTDKSTNDQQTINKQPNKRSTDDLTDDQQQYNNNNNTNKEINKQGNNERDSATDPHFDVFWMMYPRKVSKQDAINAWKKLKPDAETVGAILSGLSKWKNCDQWTQDNGQFIQYPATWLNKRLWEDDVQPARRPEPVKPAKQVIAQQYGQRDYSDVQAFYDAEQDREMEEYMRKEGLLNGR